MIVHFIVNTVLHVAWYATYKIVQAGQEHFHAIFTVLGPFGVPAYRYVSQAGTQGSFSLKQWIAYTLGYWILLLGTRDLVEFVTLGSPLLDDTLTLLRISLAVYWFSICRKGLAGSIRNIWYLVTLISSRVSLARLGACHTIAACCRWMGGWNHIDNTNNNAAPYYSNDEEVPIQLQPVGRISTVGMFMQIATSSLSALLCHLSFPQIPSFGSLLSMVPHMVGRATYSLWNYTRNWMRSGPILTCVALFNSLLVLAVVVCQRFQYDIRQWLINGLVPQVLNLKARLVHSSAVISTTFATIPRAVDPIAAFHEFLRMVRAVLGHLLPTADLVHRVYIGNRRAPLRFFSAYGLAHVLLANAGLIPPGVFAACETLLAILCPTRRLAADRTVGGMLVLLLIATGSVVIFLTQSGSGRYPLVCHILGTVMPLLAAVVGALYLQRQPISLWLLLAKLPNVLVTNAPQLSSWASRVLASLWVLAHPVFLCQYHLLSTVAPASDGAVASFCRQRERFIASGTKAVAMVTQLHFAIHEYGAIAAVLSFLFISGAFRTLLARLISIACDSREIGIYHMLLSILTSSLAHWHYRPGLLTVHRSVHRFFRPLLSSLMLLCAGGLVYRGRSLIPLNPCTVFGFPTGFRITNIDLRQAYHKVRGPWYAGGEASAIAQFEQSIDAYHIPAKPEATCECLAYYDTPIWMMSQVRCQCEQDTVAVVGPPAEVLGCEIDFGVDEDIVSEVVYLGQVCFDEDGLVVLCEYDPAVVGEEA